MRRTRRGEETQHARSPFRGGSGNNPSQGIPGPFSQAPPNMDNGCTCRTAAQLINWSSPRAEITLPIRKQEAPALEGTGALA